MDKLKKKFFLKLPFALILAFLGSQILVTKVTYKDIPVVRSSFKAAVQNLPKKTGDQIKRLAQNSKQVLREPKESLLGQQLPPPWIQPEVKPTIVAYQPPVYIPPTATPRPINQPATATPLPTQSPTQNPQQPFPPTSTPTSYPSPTPLPTQPPEIPPPLAGGQKKTQLLDLVNQERQKNGVSAVAYNTALERAAQAHAEDMDVNNYFSHTGKDGSTPADRAIRAGYGSSWVGENIAKGSSSPSQIFNMWMGSNGHRQNMLNPTWKSAGIGISSNIWVLLLGAK